MNGHSVILVGNNPGITTGSGFAGRFSNEVTRLMIGNAPTAAAIARGRAAANVARLDSMLRNMRSENPESAARVDSLMGELRDNLQKRGDSAGAVLRADSFSPSAGFHMARQLEFVYADVLREQFPVQNAFTLFPIDTSVDPGARWHTVRRIYQDGEAVVYRGGTNGVPRVGVSQREQQFPVRHFVTSFGYSLWEALSSAFANTSQVAELLRTARDVLMEFANNKFWYGDATNGLYGVLDYPWLDKKFVATAFDGTANPDDVLAELNALANFPAEVSKSTFKPNTLVVSTRVRNYLMTPPRSATTDTTIGEFWLRTNSLGITAIQEAHELQGAGPGGTDGVLFYRNDRLGISLVMPQPFSTLPVQSMGFDDVTFCWMSSGGVVMRDVGNNILGWVDAG